MVVYEIPPEFNFRYYLLSDKLRHMLPLSFLLNFLPRDMAFTDDVAFSNILLFLLLHVGGVQSLVFLFRYLLFYKLFLYTTTLIFQTSVSVKAI